MTSAEYEARAVAQALEAIETMRGFMDEAERNVKRQTCTPLKAITTVMHAIGWGHANATSRLDSAAMWLEFANNLRSQSRYG